MPTGTRSAVRRVQRLLRQAMASSGLDFSGGTVVVAVSGGADSLSLLHALTHTAPALGIRSLHAAHLDHGLRGESGQQDSAFVQAQARAWGLAVTAERADVAAYRKGRKGMSLEMAARELRHRFLADLAQRLGAAAVALGHTADDQAETVLLHLLRGAGIAGLQGMRPVSPSPEQGAGPTLLVRPFLGVWRSETQAYCLEAGLEPRIDASNDSMRFTRNRLRRQTIPALEALNPSVRRTLVRLARTAGRDADFLEAAVAEHWPQIVSSGGGGLRLRAEALKALHPALQVRLLLRACRDTAGIVGQGRAEAALRLLHEPPGKSMQLSADWLLSTGHRHLTLAKPEDAPPAPYAALEGVHSLNIPGDTGLPGWRVSTALAPIEDAPRVDGPWHVQLDAGAAGVELSVRSWLPGDRMQPSGMRGAKKLQDIFTDAKAPKAWRAGIPVVVSPKGIVWVVGLRVAEWARPAAETRRVLDMKFEPGGNGPYEDAP